MGSNSHSQEEVRLEDSVGVLFNGGVEYGYECKIFHTTNPLKSDEILECSDMERTVGVASPIKLECRQAGIRTWKCLYPVGSLDGNAYGVHNVACVQDDECKDDQVCAYWLKQGSMGTCMDPLDK